MKPVTLGAVCLAALFTFNSAKAAIIYDVLPNAGVINYMAVPGGQFGGDVFTPTNYGPVCQVDGVFVDTTGAGGAFTITVDLWCNECLGCKGVENNGSRVFAIALPPSPFGPTAYRITFPINPALTWIPVPARTPWVGISFYVEPPVGNPPPMCPIGRVPQLVPAFADAAPTVGTGVNGFSLDINPQDCCLLTGLNIPPGLIGCIGGEWITAPVGPGWANGNMLVTIHDCPPASIGLPVPSLNQEVQISRLDIPVVEHQQAAIKK